MAVTHADGNKTTYLYYQNVEQKAVNGGTETIITPVSYTHLDVYKRQTLLSLNQQEKPKDMFHFRNSQYL